MCNCKPAPMPAKAGRYRVQTHSHSWAEAVIDPEAEYPILKLTGTTEHDAWQMGGGKILHRGPGVAFKYVNLPWSGLGGEMIIKIGERLGDL